MQLLNSYDVWHLYRKYHAINLFCPKEKNWGPKKLKFITQVYILIYNYNYVHVTQTNVLNIDFKSLAFMAWFENRKNILL